MTGSKPKAGDYKVVAQKILDEAIALYCGYLSTVMLYPESMDEIRWANKSWKGGCDKCETEMKANDKITRMIHAVVCRECINIVDIAIGMYSEGALAEGPAIIISFLNDIYGFNFCLSDIGGQHQPFVRPGDPVWISESFSINLTNCICVSIFYEGV